MLLSLAFSVDVPFLRENVWATSEEYAMKASGQQVCYSIPMPVLAGAGRKTIVTEESVQKLVDALREDCTILQACEYAGISTRVFYDHQANDPEFSAKIQGARQWFGIVSRHSLIQSIKNGNGELALKALKAREPELYAPDNSTTVNVLQTLSLEEITQRRKQLNIEIARLREGGTPLGGGGEAEALPLASPDTAHEGAPETTGTHQESEAH